MNEPPNDEKRDLKQQPLAQPTTTQSPITSLNAQQPFQEENSDITPEEFAHVTTSKASVVHQEKKESDDRGSHSKVRFQPKEIDDDSQSKPSTSRESPDFRTIHHQRSPSQTLSASSRASQYFGRIASRLRRIMEGHHKTPEITSVKSEAPPWTHGVDQSIQTEPQREPRTSSFGLFLWGEASNNTFWSPENTALLIGVIVAAIVTLVLAILILLKYKKEKIVEQTEISAKVIKREKWNPTNRYLQHK